MARRNKIYILNNTYFLTATILGWRNVFTNDTYCQAVFTWFDYCINNYRNRVQGYVIMPNHWHVLMYVTDSSPRLPVLMMNAKRFMAYELVRLLRRSKRIELLNFFKSQADPGVNAKHKVFTDEYDSLVIESQKFFLQKLNYIHNNPVRAGLVGEPADYRYSSADNYINGKGYYNNMELVDFT